MSSEAKAGLEVLMGKKLRNKANKIDLENAEKIASMVAYCQVVKTRKKGFINLLMRGKEGLEVFEILEQVLDGVGKRQWDPQVARPQAKDLKLAVEAARRAARGS